MTTGSSPHFLGIDLGTSSLKLQAIDETATVIAEAGVPITTQVPRPGWAEQDPEGWWAAVATACRALWAGGQTDPARIAAIGLTGQMHGAVFLDAAGALLRPALIWADARTTAQVATIQDRIPDVILLARTGNRANTSFQAAKILWVQQEEPEVAARTGRVLLPKDYLRRRLTGTDATDPSDAGGTLLCDLAGRTWSPALLDALGIPAAWLPPVVESAVVTGQVTADAALATGLRAGTPVVAGGGDAPCAAFGQGLAGAPDPQPPAFVSLGTAGQIFMATAAPVVDPRGRVHSLPHVVPGRWYVMGAVLAAGAALRWWHDILHPPGTPGALPYAQLDAEAATVPPGAEGVLFLPYLLGERTPHLDPRARAGFYGLRLDHTRAHLGRAVLEGVVFALRDGLEVCRELGLAPGEIRPAGGGATGTLWPAILRDGLGLPVRAPLAGQSAAFGAALLAAVGAGAFPSAEAAAAAIPLGPPTDPDPAAVTAYTAAYGRYRALYPALRALFAAE